VSHMCAEFGHPGPKEVQIVEHDFAGITNFRAFCGCPCDRRIGQFVLPREEIILVEVIQRPTLVIRNCPAPFEAVKAIRTDGGENGDAEWISSSKKVNRLVKAQLVKASADEMHHLGPLEYPDTQLALGNRDESWLKLSGNTL